MDKTVGEFLLVGWQK